MVHTRTKQPPIVFNQPLTLEPGAMPPIGTSRPRFCSGISDRTGPPRLGGRGSVPRGAVRPDRVVVLPPAFDEHLGLKRRIERFPCQQLVPKQHERSSPHSRSPTVTPAR